MRIEDVSHEAHAHRILVRLRYLIVAFSFIGLYLRFVDEIYIYRYHHHFRQFRTIKLC